MFLASLVASDTMTLPAAANAAWKVASCSSQQLAHSLWNIPRPDNHPERALPALSGGLAYLIGRVSETTDRLLISFFYASDPQFILYVACIMGITVPPSSLLTVRIDCPAIICHVRQGSPFGILASVSNEFNIFWSHDVRT